MTKSAGSADPHTNTDRPSVLLADDNPAVLAHLATMLASSFQIVAAVSDGQIVLREAARLRPDVTVLDISMPGMSGIDVAHRLRESGSLTKVVFLTVHEDSDFVEAALAAGGSAYVIKYSLGTDLIPAIEAALSGKLFVSPSLSVEP